MTHNIIKTEKYLLVVDDSEIKAGDFYLLIPENIVKLSRSGLPINIREWAKIIANLPLNNSPVLEFVPLLPPLEDDNKEVWDQGLAAELEKLPYTKHLDDGQYNDGQLAGFEFGATWGYNKAKEKYKYTEEDLMEAMLQISEYYADNLDKDLDGHKKSLDIIKSLQQPKMPVAFECEDEYVHDDTVPYPKTLGTHPKTIVNPQGQTVLAGKYIY
jgi:hypothetical protein